MKDMFPTKTFLKCNDPSSFDMKLNQDIENFEFDTLEGKSISIKDSFSIRKEATINNVCLTTTISGAKAFCKAILFIDNFDATDIESLHQNLD